MVGIDKATKGNKEMARILLTFIVALLIIGAYGVYDEASRASSKKAQFTDQFVPAPNPPDALPRAK